MGRILLCAAVLAGAAWGQSMVEGAALAAGSAVGSVAGKGVGTGITKIMQKTGKQLEAAAKTGAVQVPPPPPLLQVGVASLPKQTPYNVPPPPPLRSEIRRPAPAPVAVVKPVEPETFEYFPPPLPPPERPTMSAEDLAGVKSGMRLSEVLNLGRNAVRVMRVVDGRLEETLRYRDGDTQLGIVHVVNGRVASVDLDN